MNKALKLFLASLLAVSLGVATVACCCIAPAVMAHFHKVAMCSHCPDQNSGDHSPNPASNCQHQLSNAEFSHAQAIAFSGHVGRPIPTPNFLDKHITVLPTVSSEVYPPGSPPLGISFTPLYLRTFNLRI